MNESYEYRDRVTKSDPSREFRFGEGRISGYLSLCLSVLSLLSVLAFLYPQYLTTQELRSVYDAELLQKILKYMMYSSLFTGLLTFVLNKGKYRWLGFAGIIITLFGFACGGYYIPLEEAGAQRFSLGVDWLVLGFLGSAIVFMTLEKIIPVYKGQHILRPEWGLDLFYFSFNHLAISAIIIFANYHASHFDWLRTEEFTAFILSVPIPIQVIAIIIAADFVLYWEHRIYHEVKTLWPIHAVHHSIESIDWLAASRGHFIQVFSERAMVMIPLYLLGADPIALNIYVTFAAIQAILIHCNVAIPFGPLKYIFVTPQFHHWHHSSEKPAIDTNYSAHTVLFDWLFKTYHLPKGQFPADFGTTVRLPRTLLGQTFYPLTVFTRRDSDSFQTKD